eukprot:gnl/Chilomastix_cuspidata/1218.p1 GENE.gnl/Chilomastix_cuspidata/1218~~gnl/Chilomastix_cuspidata/1218.p1  ORF type:complete len:539 (+),score=293.04 gnl/Chilomastix_cuspidata/1218:1145-2761(+)
MRRARAPRSASPRQCVSNRILKKGMKTSAALLFESYAAHTSAEEIDEEKIEDQVIYHLTNILEEHQKKTTGIPKFSLKISSPRRNPLQALLFATAKEQHLGEIKASMLDKDVFAEIFELLKAKSSPPLWASARADFEGLERIREKTLSYTAFASLEPSLSEAFPQCELMLRELLSSAVFAALPPAPPAASLVRPSIYVGPFVDFLWRAHTAVTAFHRMSMFDVAGDGYLSETELAVFLADQTEEFAAVATHFEIAKEYSECVMLQGFFFFLDPAGRGKVSILDLAVSDELHEFLQRAAAVDDDAHEHWFSAANVARLINEYGSLDGNSDGQLTREDLERMPPGGLSRHFLDRVMEMSQTYNDGQIDFRTYVNLQLAFRFQREPAAQRFFFAAFDVHGHGYLTKASVDIFIGDVLEKADEVFVDGAPHLRDLSDELFDAVQPRDPTRIYLEDVIGSGCGDLLIKFLAGLNPFLEYEDRERQYSTQQEMQVDEVASPPSSPDDPLDRRHRVNHFMKQFDAAEDDDDDLYAMPRGFNESPI